MRFKPLKGSWTESLRNYVKADGNDNIGDDDVVITIGIAVSHSLRHVWAKHCAECVMAKFHRVLSNPSYYLCCREEGTDALPGGHSTLCDPEQVA